MFWKCGEKMCLEWLLYREIKSDYPFTWDYVALNYS